MAIIRTLNEQDFFKEVKDYFTEKGALLLFNYLKELGRNVEIDPIALNCDYSEISLREYNKDYWTSYKNMEELQSNADNFLT